MVNYNETQQDAMPCDESDTKDKHMMKYRTVKTLVVKNFGELQHFAKFCHQFFIISIVFPKQMGFSLSTFFLPNFLQSSLIHPTFLPPTFVTVW